MNVLIVERKQELGQLWKRHLLRQGLSVDLVTSQNAAIAALCCCAYDLIVLDLVLEDGGALSVADFASYRRPEARVIFVTNTSFFRMGPFLHTAPMPAPMCKAKRRQRIWRRWWNIMQRRADRGHAVRKGPEPG